MLEREPSVLPITLKPQSAANLVMKTFYFSRGKEELQHNMAAAAVLSGFVEPLAPDATEEVLDITKQQLTSYLGRAAGRWGANVHIGIAQQKVTKYSDQNRLPLEVGMSTAESIITRYLVKREMPGEAETLTEIYEDTIDRMLRQDAQFTIPPIKREPAKTRKGQSFVVQYGLLGRSTGYSVYDALYAEAMRHIPIERDGGFDQRLRQLIPIHAEHFPDDAKLLAHHGYLDA